MGILIPIIDTEEGMFKNFFIVGISAYWIALIVMYYYHHKSNHWGEFDNHNPNLSVGYSYASILRLTQIAVQWYWPVRELSGTGHGDVSITFLPLLYN